MVSFVHTADWQLGMTRRWLDEEAQARFGAARIEAVRRLGQVADEQGCDFVVVAGDVFETHQVTSRTVGRALEALREVPVPVYLLPGNHDPVGAGSVYQQRAFRDGVPEHVHVLDRSGPVTVADGVELVAAPWPSKHPGRDLVAQALDGVGPADGTVRVLVGHGAVDVLDPARDRAETIALAPLEQALADGRLHYAALGDRHSRTSVGESGAVWYSGTPEVTSQREHAPGDVLVVQVDAGTGRAPVVTPHRVGTWVMTTLRRALDRATDVTALDESLAALPAKDRTVVRLALTGSLDLAGHARLEEVLERHTAVFAAVHHWQRHTDVVLTEHAADWGQLGLGGFVAAAAQEIHEQAVQPSEPTAESDLEVEVEPGWSFDPDRPDDPASARDALSLLYRLSRQESR